MNNLATLIGAKNLETLLSEERNTYVVLENNGVFILVENNSSVDVSKVVGIGGFNDCNSLVKFLRHQQIAIN